jgi:hypothetical protein
MSQIARFVKQGEFLSKLPALSSLTSVRTNYREFLALFGSLLP